MSWFWWGLHFPMSSYFLGSFITKINCFYHYDSSCHFNAPRHLRGVPHVPCKHTGYLQFSGRSLFDDLKDLILPQRGWSVLTLSPQWFFSLHLSSPLLLLQPHNVIFEENLKNYKAIYILQLVYESTATRTCFCFCRWRVEKDIEPPMLEKWKSWLLHVQKVVSSHNPHLAKNRMGRTVQLDVNADLGSHPEAWILFRVRQQSVCLYCNE